MKVAVVHTGARDSYQVAEAFYERAQLFKLFTSTYISHARSELLSRMGIVNRGRTGPISQECVSAFYSVDMFKRLGRILGAEQAASQFAERAFGRQAARQCGQADVVISYNYVAQHVLPNVRSRKVLFQCHPNPAALSLLGKSDDKLRAYGFALEREFSWGPDYKAALQGEWRFADSIIAPSSFVKESLVMAGSSPDKIKVVAYGCPPTTRTEPRKAPTGRLSLLFVGQFVWRKGVDQLAAFARQISDRGDLTIVSRGFVDETLLALVKEQPNVKFLFGISNEQLRMCYENSHALVFPSRYEGYGLVVNEALSHGLPVIATRNTALADISRTHKAGSIMSDISSDAMLASICDIFDQGAYSGFSEQALAFARHNPWPVFRDRVREVVGAL